jgi:hypothetical protein
MENASHCLLHVAAGAAGPPQAEPTTAPAIMWPAFRTKAPRLSARSPALSMTCCVPYPNSRVAGPRRLPSGRRLGSFICVPLLPAVLHESCRKNGLCRHGSEQGNTFREQWTTRRLISAANKITYGYFLARWIRASVTLGNNAVNHAIVPPSETAVSSCPDADKENLSGGPF